MFKRKTDPATATSASPAVDTVQQARTRARHRLIGAAVLLIVGIIGFPLVFESQPRPIPVDIPIEIPKKDGAPPLVMPAERPNAPTPSTSRVDAPPAAGLAVAGAARTSPDASPPGQVASTNVGDGIITESRSEAGREVAPSTVSPPSSSSLRSTDRPPAKIAATEPARKASASVAASTVAVAPVAASAKTSASSEGIDGTRARALLEGKPTAQAGSAEVTRFVVQVGAFADAVAARETRQKAEKLGLKTYTQVAETASGSRIRVRVGPFATHDEADRALAKAKAAGLSAVLLTL